MKCWILIGKYQSTDWHEQLSMKWLFQGMMQKWFSNIFISSKGKGINKKLLLIDLHVVEWFKVTNSDANIGMEIGGIEI
jgi:hypothetical protein